MDDSPFANLPIQKRDGFWANKVWLIMCRIYDETSVDLSPAVEAVFKKRSDRQYIFSLSTLRKIHNIIELIYCVTHSTKPIDEHNFYDDYFQIKFISERMNKYCPHVHISVNRISGSPNHKIISARRKKYSDIVRNFSKSSRSRFSRIVFCNDLLNILVKFLNVPCRIKK